MNKRKTNFSSLLQAFCVLLLLTSCGGGGDSATSTTSTQSPSISSPAYTLSDEQTKLTADHGIPEYLTISVNSDTGRREESWIYTKLGKIYIFWDGTRVQEQNLTVDPNDYSNPPYIDPQRFDNASKKSDIEGIFGNDYKVIDQSAGSLSFVSWYYEDLGLVVSFSGDQLVTVQTVDLP